MRDYSYSESALLAKEREKSILSAALAHDLVSVVMRRLSSLSGQRPPARRTERTGLRRMMLLSTIDRLAVTRLLAGYGLDLRLVAAAEPIPGSYWGESEAGLRGNCAVRAHRHAAAFDAARGGALHLHEPGTPRRARPRCRR